MVLFRVFKCGKGSSASQRFVPHTACLTTQNNALLIHSSKEPEREQDNRCCDMVREVQISSGCKRDAAVTDCTLLLEPVVLL